MIEVVKQMPRPVPQPAFSRKPQKKRKKTKREPWKYLKLIDIGPDYVGKLERVFDFVNKRKGNIVEATYCELGKDYVTFMHVDGSECTIEGLADEAKLSSVLFSEAIVPVELYDTPILWGNRRPVVMRMTVKCMDHPGHLLAVTRATAKRAINIPFLRAWTYHAPVSNVPLFCSTVIVEAASHDLIDDFMHEMRHVECQYNIDIDGPYPVSDESQATPSQN